MVEKPVTGDERQRREQTRAARFQSGLPPEPAGADEEAAGGGAEGGAGQAQETDTGEHASGAQPEQDR